MTARADNVVTLPFRPRLLDKPPEIKRPEPKCSHDIDLVEAMETLEIIMEIRQRAYVLKSRIGENRTVQLLAEIAGSLNG